MTPSATGTQPPILTAAPGTTYFDPARVAEIHAERDAEALIGRYTEAVAMKKVLGRDGFRGVDPATYRDEIVALIRDGLLYRQATTTGASR